MSKFEKRLSRISLPEIVPSIIRLGEQVGLDEPLLFRVKTSDNRYQTVDLRRYRDGDNLREIIGSESLIMDLLTAIKAHLGQGRRPTKGVKVWLAKVLPPLFKFITELQRHTGSAPRTAAEFQNSDGELFKTFLIQKGGSAVDRRKSYTAIHTLLSHARPSDTPPLHWPSFDIAPRRDPHIDVDPRAVKALYNACKRVLEEAGRRQVLGDKWLIEGVDPRSLTAETPRIPGRRGSVRDERWHDHANLAFLMREYMRDRILGTQVVDKATNQKLLRHLSSKGMSYAGVRYEELSTAFAPSALEVTAGILIVSMETGWIDTALAIDLTTNWYALRRGNDSDKLAKTDSVAIFATRPKTSKPHIAVGLAGPRFRSFQIIKFMEARSALLRECLREIRRGLASNPAESAQEIADIDHLLKSPWLFFNTKGTGRAAVGIFNSSSIEKDLAKIREQAISSLSAADRSDDDLVAAIARLRWSDLRDAFAAHIYKASGGNIFLVKRALDHNHISVTRHYVRQRHQIAERFEAYRRVIQTALTEVKEGRSIDPTILFLASNYDDFGETDRAKLTEYRNRMGMGCRNPKSPEPHLARDHPTGAYCAVQRCILCRQGIVLRDAFDGLADRHADLVWLRKNSNPSRWLTSTFSWELEALELARDEIFKDQVAEFNRRSDARVKAIALGDAYVFDEPEVIGVFV